MFDRLRIAGLTSLQPNSYCTQFAILCIPRLGIYGMDFYIVLNRPGYRVAKRKAKCAKIGYQHKVTKTDAVKWFQVCSSSVFKLDTAFVLLDGLRQMRLSQNHNLSSSLCARTSQAKFEGIVTG